MRVLIDNEPLTIEAEPARPLRELIDSVQAIIAQRRRVVRQVVVDGQSLPADGAEQWLARPAGQIGRVEFQTASPRDAAGETLSAVAAMLDDTGRLQKGAAERLAAGQTGKAMELLLSCLTHFRMAQEAVRQAVQVARLDLETAKIGEQTAAEVIKSLAEQLAQVKAALEARDFALLGDLLNYEFPRTAEAWKAIIAVLQEQLGE